MSSIERSLKRQIAKTGVRFFLASLALAATSCGPNPRDESLAGCIEFEGPSNRLDNSGHSIVANLNGRRITFFAKGDLALEVKRYYNVNDRVKVVLTAVADPGSSREEAGQDLDTRMQVLRSISTLKLTHLHGGEYTPQSSFTIDKVEGHPCKAAISAH